MDSAYVNLSFKNLEKKLILMYLILICFSKFCFSQTIRYHEYYQTASDYKIVRWNIPNDSLTSFKIILKNFQMIKDEWLNSVF